MARAASAPVPVLRQLSEQVRDNPLPQGRAARTLHEVAAPRPSRVLIADDHPLIRDALRQDLEQGGLEVCAEVSTGADAITAAVRERPDLCLLDMQMPANGMAAVKAIRQALPATKVVLITATPDESGIVAAAHAGADGYLPKDVNPQRLAHIVSAVIDGETAYPRRLLRVLLGALRQPDP